MAFRGVSATNLAAPGTIGGATPGAGTFTTCRTVPVAVSALPSAATAGAGARAFVTDATTTFILGLGLAVVGGGANAVPVYSDATIWRIG